MPTLKQSSVKLPLLLALPVLLVLGVAAVFLIPDDPPQPIPTPPPLSNDEPVPHVDNPDPLVDSNPRPRPKPRPDAPAEVAVAEAMEAEAGKSLDVIRARLELKFKYAEYTLDRTWTLEQVVRRIDTLTGTHFNAADYTLIFPEGDDAIALVSCATIQGGALPDGPLTMTLNLRTGKSTRQGRILARNADGYVLLGEAEYRQASEVLRDAVLNHVFRQARATSGLAEFMPVELRDDSVFDASDFTATSLKSSAKTAEFACRSLHGEQLAEPAVVTVDYTARAVKLSTVGSRGWMEPPRDREQFTRRSRWLMSEVSNHAMRLFDAGTTPAEIKLEAAEDSRWSWGYSEIMPFDVKIVECTAGRVVLEVATCFGRALPFAKVRYVAEPATGTYEFE